MTKVKQVREVKVSARQKAENDMADFAALANRKATIQADVKERTAAINAEYADELSQIESKLEKLETELNIFAEANPEEFKGKKELKLETGKIGWRLDTGKLVYQDGANMDAFHELLEDQLPDALETKINSKVVISACKIIGKLPVKLAEIGIAVEQKDKFFVTPNKA